jgi:hypothetical protein
MASNTKIEDSARTLGNQAGEDRTLLRQEEQDDKERVEAIYVAVFTVFIDSIMFSIVLPSMAIYLQTFTPSSSPDYALYLGILVAAHPFGQLVCKFSAFVSVS